MTVKMLQFAIATFFTVHSVKKTVAYQTTMQKTFILLNASCTLYSTCIRDWRIEHHVNEAGRGELIQRYTASAVLTAGSVYLSPYKHSYTHKHTNKK
jgi:hypothetical protein